MRILVVEDTPSVRLVLARVLRQWGHDVLEAGDGEAAWEILRRERVRLVVSDWMMPALDGPGLCRRIRAAGFDEYVYFILLTSRDEEADLVEGMNAGADDFVTKPFSRAELDVRLKAGIRVLELQQRLARQNAELSETLGIVRRDLEAAARTQFSMLPDNATCFGPTRFDWLYSPATYIGGDILNYFVVDDRLLAFYAIDVSGHGVPAALVSSTLNKFITPALCREVLQGAGRERDPGPEAIVERLNRDFLDYGEDDFYFTMLLALHETASGRTRVCQAAHPHPVLIPRDAQIEVLGEGGMPVAMLDMARYDSFEFEMAPGDRLILYSDGVTECRSTGGEQFGMERFKSFLLDRRALDNPALLDALRNELAHFSGGKAPDDDLSVLCVERLALDD